jgi:uncharacterized protein
MLDQKYPARFSTARTWLLILSPFVVIALGHGAALFGQAQFGMRAWVLLTVVFWTTMAVFIALAGGWPSFLMRLKPGKRAWRSSLLAVLIGFAPLPLIILFWPVLASPLIWVPWLIFALLNPFLEESYWRGVLTDVTAHWPSWLAIIYSSTLFAASHPLMWGTFSIANRTPETVIITFLMGVFWTISYRRTGSLRWAIAGHILTDLFNLSIGAFENQFPTSAPLW